jgi:TPR repeat protein
MKIIPLFIGLFLLTHFSFAQNQSYELSNGGTKVSSGMSAWIRSKDFRSMQFRVACISKMNEEGFYTWTIDFQSTYKEGSFDVFVGPNFEAIKKTFDTGSYGESTKISTTMQDANPSPNKKHHFRGDFKVPSNTSFYIVFTAMNIQTEANRDLGMKYLATDSGIPCIQCQYSQYEGCPNYKNPTNIIISSRNYGQYVNLANVGGNTSSYPNSQQQSQNANPSTEMAQTAISLLQSFTGLNSRDRIRAKRAERAAQQKNNSQEESSTQYETPPSTNVTYDYSTVVKSATAESNKNTYEGYKNAIKLLEPYVYKMNGNDLNSLGFYYWKIQDYVPATKYYKMSGENGSDWGYNNLALCYQNGWGVNKNNVEAFDYYNKVAPTFENIGETYHQMGHLCTAGANNTKGTADYIMASSYYSMGANSNNAECMLHLGELYDTGGQLKTNLKLAKYWYKKACDLKTEKACTKLRALE